MYLAFSPHEQEEALPIKRYFDGAYNACNKNGGTAHCTCSATPHNVISDPRADLSELFFCLPDTCECRHGGVEKLEPMVSR